MHLYAKCLGESHAEAILFISGMTGSHKSWDENFQSLSRAWKMVLIDTLGFGHSPRPDIAYTLDDHLSAIKETLQSLNISRTHIIGHALPWFQNEQEARKAISSSSLFHSWLAMDTLLARAACVLMCTLRPLLIPIMPLVIRDVPAAVARDSLRHTWLSYSRSLQNIIFRAETTNWVQRIEQPILLIHGAQDKTAPLENVKNNFARLRHAELVELEADHGLVFTQSNIIATKIEEFLQSRNCISFDSVD